MTKQQHRMRSPERSREKITPRQKTPPAGCTQLTLFELHFPFSFRCFFLILGLIFRWRLYPLVAFGNLVVPLSFSLAPRSNSTAEGS